MVEYIYSHDYIKNRTIIKYFTNIKDIDNFYPENNIGCNHNFFMIIFCMFLSILFVYPAACLIFLGEKKINIEKKNI
jgi:hypothetical protein